MLIQFYDLGGDPVFDLIFNSLTLPKNSNSVTGVLRDFLYCEIFLHSPPSNKNAVCQGQGESGTLLFLNSLILWRSFDLFPLFGELFPLFGEF